MKPLIVGFIKGDPDGHAVDDFDRLNPACVIAEIGLSLIKGVCRARVHETVIVPFDDVGIDNRAVMEFYILSDGESIDRAIIGDCPRLGDRRFELCGGGTGVSQIEHDSAFDETVDGVGRQAATRDLRVKNTHLARHAPHKGAALRLRICCGAARESERTRYRQSAQQAFQFNLSHRNLPKVVCCLWRAIDFDADRVLSCLCWPGSLRIENRRPFIFPGFGFFQLRRHADQRRFIVQFGSKMHADRQTVRRPMQRQ